MKSDELAKITKDAKAGVVAYGKTMTLVRRSDPAWAIELPGHGEDGTIELSTSDHTVGWYFRPWHYKWTLAQLREVVAVLEQLNEVA